MDRIANELFWTSAPDGKRADGSADNRQKPALFDALHVVKPDGTNNPVTYNVAQGLLKIVQRAMAAGVMIELYRQMQEVSLFCFVNNALPRIKAHLYENIDRFYTVEEAVALAERFEVGRSGGAISKFSINSFHDHMNNTQSEYNTVNTENNVSSELAAQTQEELDHHYHDQPYDGQINAIGRGFRRGGRRGTRSWSRGRGNSGGNFRFPTTANPIGGPGLGNYYQANDPAASKKNLLCYRCGSASHVVKDCHHPPVTTNGPKYFAGRGRGRFRTFQRREKFNSLGVYLGTEDVPVYYDSETDRVEELPDTTHDEGDDYDESGEINVLNENRFGNLDYLGVAEDEINIESYFRDNTPRKEI